MALQNSSGTPITISKLYLLQPAMQFLVLFKNFLACTFVLQNNQNALNIRENIITLFARALVVFDNSTRPKDYIRLPKR